MNNKNFVPHSDKWSPNRVTEYLVKIEAEVLRPGTVFLGNALVNVGLYKDVWAYWKRKFYDYDDIAEMMLRIESICEARLFMGALQKEFAPWVAIFALKSHYGWDDRPAPEPIKIQEPQQPESHEPELIFELANDEALIIPWKPRDKR